MLSVFVSSNCHTLMTYTCITLCWVRLMQGIGKNLETFTGHVQTIADGLPNQPPVPAIAERLSQRTSALSQDSSRLSKALQDAAGVPGEVADAGIADLNDALAKYIDGELQCTVQFRQYSKQQCTVSVWGESGVGWCAWGGC